MENKAFNVIRSIERLGVTDKGKKRAHARGRSYRAAVQLNDAGRKLLGDMTHAFVRLSDAPPSTKYPAWTVSIKGLSLHFTGKKGAVNLVFVTFPYFPWVKADSIVNLGTYAVALKEELDWQVKLNLWRKILQTEHFHRHLGKFFLHFPLITYRSNRKYSNLHYFATEQHDYVRFHVKYIGNDILLFAEYYDKPASIERIRRDAVIEQIGTVHLEERTDEVIPYFDVLQTGAHLKPLEDDEIIKLRHDMYRISCERRLMEREEIKNE
ncbi:hypothetical protein [Macrococcus equipercicus]|uniref:Uncharacterized protein n=1 Tax=Macrococcus equipercicus TaxID=69967 RepID=A0A9Q9BLV4_9STAP|nr:hypothetical protein [Macrococcus equipercicus]KAA1039607.1 hypothetical protein ERX35_005905 [Macrococcus equipercicus]UTH13938.1 hypothetical protein KFV11_00765 [Macrococcus equipercicus]